MEELLKQLPKEYAEQFESTPVASEATAFYAKNRKAARYMFGYPAYFNPISPLTQYLLLMHYASPFSNNCGDIEERGNYAMDTKDMERRIVGLYAEKFGMGKNFWGYVTSGGSESNSCGISLAFAKHPKSIVAHITNVQANHFGNTKPTVQKERNNAEITLHIFAVNTFQQLDTFI